MKKKGRGKGKPRDIYEKQKQENGKEQNVSFYSLHSLLTACDL